jgi:predicted glycosyltransferase involved in capsule biosynthesis
MPQVNKKYFKQVYNDSEFNRIPDFRNQLLWYPNLTLNTNETQISFYTSDVTGDFEICIEGFTERGKPVSEKQFISVKSK